MPERSDDVDEVDATDSPAFVEDDGSSVGDNSVGDVEEDGSERAELSSEPEDDNDYGNEDAGGEEDGAGSGSEDGIDGDGLITADASAGSDSSKKRKQKAAATAGDASSAPDSNDVAPADGAQPPVAKKRGKQAAKQDFIVPVEQKSDLLFVSFDVETTGWGRGAAAARPIGR